jgi:predicted RNA-binding Zn-ribbon protein involved in translation (DUF1610 family)
LSEAAVGAIARGESMRAQEKVRYVCPACGEDNLVIADLSAGREQEFVEDCTVCCRPILLQVYVEGEDRVSVRASLE